MFFLELQPYVTRYIIQQLLAKWIFSFFYKDTSWLLEMHLA